MVKNTHANEGDARDVDSIPELGRSSGEGIPTPLFLPGESHGQRSLVGYRLWGCKESNTTAHTHTHRQNTRTTMRIDELLCNVLKLCLACREHSINTREQR